MFNKAFKRFQFKTGQLLAECIERFFFCNGVRAQKACKLTVDFSFNRRLCFFVFKKFDISFEVVMIAFDRIDDVGNFGL